MNDSKTPNFSPNIMKFSLGQVVTTLGISELLTPQEISMLLDRHVMGDWGDMSKSDKNLNDQALAMGLGRLFSSYITPKGKVWIITEADRSITTVLLPSEY